MEVLSYSSPFTGLSSSRNKILNRTFGSCFLCLKKKKCSCSSHFQRTRGSIENQNFETFIEVWANAKFEKIYGFEPSIIDCLLHNVKVGDIRWEGSKFSRSEKYDAPLIQAGVETKHILRYIKTHGITPGMTQSLIKCNNAIPREDIQKFVQFIAGMDRVFFKTIEPYLNFIFFQQEHLEAGEIYSNTIDEIYSEDRFCDKVLRFSSVDSPLRKVVQKWMDEEIERMSTFFDEDFIFSEEQIG